MTDTQKTGKGKIIEAPSVLRLITVVFFSSILPAHVNALTPGQVFDKIKDSIVVVQTLDAQGKVKGRGSGVLISSDRVATNCHVVAGDVRCKAGRGKEFVPADLYVEDGDKDICILDVKGIQGKPAQFGDAAGLKVGDPVYAVGAPQGLEISDGIVAQLRGGPPPLIQTTAAISPGASGGGLFDGKGQLVGLTTIFLEDGQSFYFALPVNWLRDVTPGRKPAAEGHGRVEWFKRAIVLEQMEDWQGMRAWCQKWTKSEPENTEAWYNLGNTHGNLKRFTEAVDAYREVLRINPDYTVVWYNLGITYGKLNRFTEAIDAYRQALRINSTHTNAWNNLGIAYHSLNRFTEAIDACREALRINPDYAEAWYNLGNAHYNLNRFSEAIDACRKALRINPDYAEAWYTLGNAHYNLNRFDEAIDAYRQALRVNSTHTNAWNNLGVAYYRLDRFSDAIEAYREGLRINPDHAETWINLGISYGKLDRFNDAVAALRQALRINPEYASAWYNLGVIYSISGNRTAALDAVKELRRLDPAKADKIYNLIVPR